MKQELFYNVFNNNCVDGPMNLIFDKKRAMINHYFSSVLEYTINDVCTNLLQKNKFFNIKQTNYVDMLDLYIDIDPLHIKNTTDLYKLFRRFIKFNNRNGIENFFDYMCSRVEWRQRNNIFFSIFQNPIYLPADFMNEVEKKKKNNIWVDVDELDESYENDYKNNIEYTSEKQLCSFGTPFMYQGKRLYPGKKISDVIMLYTKSSEFRDFQYNNIVLQF